MVTQKAESITNELVVLVKWESRMVVILDIC